MPKWLPVPVNLKEVPIPDHPTGNSNLIHQHKVIQRQGDQELRGGEPKGKDAPGLDERDEDDLPEELAEGVVKPDDGSKPHLPSMKPATSSKEPAGEASGEGGTGAGGDPGP